MIKKVWYTLAPLALIGALLVGCERDAQVASRNLSHAADMFEIQRRIVFFNGITGEYMLEVHGRCSIGTGSTARSLTITCKEGPDKYEKHFLGLSDNVSWFAEQLELADVSTYHNRIIFKPQALVPEIDINVDGDELLKNRH